MKIKKLKKNDLYSFFKYLKKNFKSNHIFYKSNELFDWQYLSKNDYNFYIFKVKSNIKAVQGYIPTSRYDKKLKDDTIFLSIWSSSEVSAGTKLFYHFIKKNKCNLLVGLGSSRESFLFQKMLDFNCGYMDHYFLTNSERHKKLISPKSFSNWKSNLIVKNFKEIVSKKEIMKIDNNIFKEQYPKKTNQYILNRYFKHQFYKYNIYEVQRDQKTIAVFVTRICEFNKKTAIRIVDFFGKNHNFHHGKYLFRHLLQKNNSEFLDIYSYGIPKMNLARSGLDNVEKYKKNNIIIPNYFEPFVKKNIKLPYAFKTSEKIKKKVRFFKADSDLDRPNILR
ncbi:hypothetical protein N9407_00535 [Candidatus Pelagibacter sp.]|nr:hypothetical protein [Candidatus Pelagibacter sp.]